jgi:hypothetical protein
MAPTNLTLGVTRGPFLSAKSQYIVHFFTFDDILSSENVQKFFLYAFFGLGTILNTYKYGAKELNVGGDQGTILKCMLFYAKLF